MFSVAHFIESDDVAVILSSWTKNGKVYWPPFKSTTKVTAAIKDKANHSQEWEQFTCRVLSTTGKLSPESHGSSFSV